MLSVRSNIMLRTILWQKHLKFMWYTDLRKTILFCVLIMNANASQFYLVLKICPVKLNVQNCIFYANQFTCIAEVFSLKKNSRFVVIVFRS